MKFIPPVRRKEGTAFGKKYHYYTDGDNNRIPGVTTILGGGIPKPALINWAANSIAEGALDNWDQLTTIPPAKRLKALQEFRYEKSNTAKNKGTKVHAYAEHLVQGEPVTLDGDDENLRPYIDNYAQFLDQWNVQPVLVEVVVVHYGHGWAGTLDLVADITIPGGDVERWLLDIKTGDTGIYGETALQLEAYRNAQFYVDNDGNEQPMIPVDHCGAIWVTADSATLLPTEPTYQRETDGPDDPPIPVYKAFRFAKEIYDLDKISRGLVGAAYLHPSHWTAHIVWGDDE